MCLLSTFIVRLIELRTFLASHVKYYSIGCHYLDFSMLSLIPFCMMIVKGLLSFGVCLFSSFWAPFITKKKLKKWSQLISWDWLESPILWRSLQITLVVSICSKPQGRAFQVFCSICFVIQVSIYWTENSENEKTFTSLQYTWKSSLLLCETGMWILLSWNYFLHLRLECWYLFIPFFVSLLCLFPWVLTRVRYFV